MGIAFLLLIFFPPSHYFHLCFLQINFYVYFRIINALWVCKYFQWNVERARTMLWLTALCPSCSCKAVPDLLIRSGSPRDPTHRLRPGRCHGSSDRKPFFLCWS